MLKKLSITHYFKYLSRQKILFVLSLLFFSLVSFGQTNTEIELLESLDTASSDLVRSKIYIELSDKVVEKSPSQGYNYAERALSFAQKSGDIRAEGRAYCCLGYCLYYKSEYLKALPFCEKGFKLAQEAKDTSVILRTLSYQSSIHSFFGNNERAITLSKRALKLSQQLNNQEKISRAYNDLGLAYIEISEYEKALSFLTKAKLINIESEDEYNLDITLNNISLIYSEMGEFELALSTLYETVDTGYDKESLDYGIYLINVGEVLQNMGEYDSALDYYLNYLKIARNYENQFDEALAFSGIAKIELELNQLDAAFKNQKKANILYEKLQVNAYYASGLAMMAKIYIRQGKYQEARPLLKKADKITENTFNQKGRAEILKLRGDLNNEQQNYEVALNYYKSALDAFEGIGSKVNAATTLYYIALVQYRLKQYEPSIINANKSLKFIQKSKYRSYLDNLYELLSKDYAAVQNFENAYIFQLKLRNIQDSLLNIEKSSHFAELQTKFYVTEKDAENDLLKSIQVQDKVTIQRRTIIGGSLAFSLFILMILAAWLQNVNNQKRKYNDILESKVEERTNELQIVNENLKESNSELERFAYIASHDLKEPLRNIVGFTFLLKRKIKHLLDEEAKGYMDFILRGTKQMNELIVDVLEFSRLNGNVLDLKEVDMNEVIDGLLDFINQTLKDENVELEVDPLSKIIVDESKISLVFRNLIENGFKYNKHQNPSIRIGYESNEDNHIFFVKDNGIGINGEYKDTIFEMFKRLHTKQDYEGTGVGLAFSKKIISQHGGDIWLDKSDKNGSTFKFSIPKKISQ
ncbi:MAG: signal transduction histidine kinase [Cognaticolwellia sp.]|jgi:signal transduction histidine kinase